MRQVQHRNVSKLGTITQLIDGIQQVHPEGFTLRKVLSLTFIHDNSGLLLCGTMKYSFTWA